MDPRRISPGQNNGPLTACEVTCPSAERLINLFTKLTPSILNNLSFSIIRLVQDLDVLGNAVNALDHGFILCLADFQHMMRLTRVPC